ncbi:similar to Saccharomyces cerevisiae YLR286C CTS1 Endochitinase, required for cell separation after mitosis [Maudiozyma barnettii]|uniref:chitinase n=1 Tax=Maudiozyma barnettii TaxID=61262 RepID=A0A8H2ZJC5_9SACH|nr:chitinase [Kazachstania barnettii]CAB4255858.1 similar to Saccharomyces cerevisiae YLR286C CTS1 Endochitinase, required for cell separation after mitosis [Kazachstania barnettii]CAD1784418.1 similar to Saccharomyces cerevisiae YLR286C CTS1 Endochitinase, required for cell separation after mitosis [Kazachstania barnettii]
MLQTQFLIITTILLLRSLVYAFDNNAQNNVAVYWGQNSHGSQESLATYCQSSDADIFLLSFADAFPTITLNFANACSETFADDSGLLHCSQIAADIATCQSLGKKVLLSLGGASGAYGFTDNSQAETFAQTLWDTFAEGTGVTNRPFDSAIVDGFDFDIENNNNVGYAALVTKLRTLFATGSKQYYISAAPQCPYPDASVGDLLANADVDFAFIQFYNNYCNVETSFNWDTWVNYAENISPNSNIKLYLGLPGSATAAGSGYISDLSVLKTTIEKISTFANFGGVSLWDASQAFNNDIDGETYIHAVKSLLDDNVSFSSATTTTAAANTHSSSRITTTLQPTTSTTSEDDTVTTISSEDIPTDTSSIVMTTTTSNVAQVTTTSDDINNSVTATTEGKNVDEPSVRTRSQESTVVDVGATSTTAMATTSDIAATTAATTATTMATVATTSNAQVATATTTTSSASTDSAAHTIAKNLNTQYAAGQYNGQATCTDGELACSADGSFAMCNFGSWVSMPCAAGTTCYAYDYDNTVLTQCGFTEQKAQFM